MSTDITISHIIYLLLILIILIFMVLRKDIVLPCIIGIFIMGFSVSFSVVTGIQVLYRAIYVSGRELWGVILVIALIISMTKGLEDAKADILMMRPVLKLFVNSAVSFWAMGLTMLMISLFIWPSPAVGLLGALFIPAALRSGLPRMGVAMAINLFGFGMALSGDYFIQGAPAITAKSAGLPLEVMMRKGWVLWLTMAVVTSLSAFLLVIRDIRRNRTRGIVNDEKDMHLHVDLKGNKVASRMAIITPLLFLINMVIMYLYHLRGNHATMLIGGTAILILLVTVISLHKNKAFSRLTDYLRYGFLEGFKIFVPVIVIGGFFFLGSETTGKAILGDATLSILMDWGQFLAQHIPINKWSVIIIQVLAGGITGLSGSGFSGLPLVGALSKTFSYTVDIDPNILANLGQIVTIWVGGGTVVPWSVIPVAAVCRVKPDELARCNLIPVTIGLVVTCLVALFLI